MPAVTFKIDRREFDRTLRTYAGFSKRTNKQICDSKGFFIAIRACAFTYRTAKGEIENELNAETRTIRQLNPKTGRMRNVRRAFSLLSGTGIAPLAALIINARRGRKGQRGLYGAKMERAMFRLLAVRNKSRAFIASCWLPAINGLRSWADKAGTPLQDRAVKQVGRPKGGATPAREGWACKTTIFNLANAKHDHKEALLKYGAPALQAAFDAEEQSMKEYIEKKMRETARKAGIRTN